MFDIIGDIHGYASLLKKLLRDLGYDNRKGFFRHPERKAVFVGDFTNRGPEIIETLAIVRAMVDAGCAYAILGNHEVNNILYHLRNQKKEPLLSDQGKRFASVTQTIQQFKNAPSEWKDYRRWLRTLPLFLEMEGIRIVHAYWSDSNIQVLKNNLPPGKISKTIFRNMVEDSGSDLSQAILQTIRGIHLVMPSDMKIFDHRLRNHRFFRIRWWENPDGKTFHDWSFESKFHLPRYSIPPEIYPSFEVYPEDGPPVFFGHYCRGKGPFIIKNNICCVDSCVSSRKVLAAYRWNGETVLRSENMRFVSVE